MPRELSQNLGGGGGGPLPALDPPLVLEDDRIELSEIDGLFGETENLKWP